MLDLRNQVVRDLPHNIRHDLPSLTNTYAPVIKPVAAQLHALGGRRYKKQVIPLFMLTIFKRDLYLRLSRLAKDPLHPFLEHQIEIIPKVPFRISRRDNRSSYTHNPPSFCELKSRQGGTQRCDAERRAA